MGAVEEGGKVAGGIVQALGTQPAVLALIVANVAMLAFMFYAMHAAATFRNDMLKEAFKYQREVSDLLSKCVIPQRSSLQDGIIDPMIEK
jgi:hypothetical protein